MALRPPGLRVVWIPEREVDRLAQAPRPARRPGGAPRDRPACGVPEGYVLRPSLPVSAASFITRFSEVPSLPTACRAADKGRTHDQFKDREDPWPGHPAVRAGEDLAHRYDDDSPERGRRARRSRGRTDSDPTPTGKDDRLWPGSSRGGWLLPPTRERGDAT